MKETLGEELCKSTMDTKVEEQREGKEEVILVNFFAVIKDSVSNLVRNHINYTLEKSMPKLRSIRKVIRWE